MPRVSASRRWANRATRPDSVGEVVLEAHLALGLRTPVDDEPDTGLGTFYCWALIDLAG
jgi:hypothetical protein